MDRRVLGAVSVCLEEAQDRVQGRAAEVVEDPPGARAQLPDAHGVLPDSRYRAQVRLVGAPPGVGLAGRAVQATAQHGLAARAEHLEPVVAEVALSLPTIAIFGSPVSLGPPTRIVSGGALAPNAAGAVATAATIASAIAPIHALLLLIIASPPPARSPVLDSRTRCRARRAPDRQRAGEHRRVAEARDLDPGRVGGSARSSSRIGASSRSPLAPMPPPSTTSSTSATAAIGATCSAIRRASSSTTARASASPARAAAKIARTSNGGSSVGPPPARPPGRSANADSAPAHGSDSRSRPRAERVVDLPGGAVVAAVQLAVQHEPGAEAGADREEHEVVDPARDAAPLLADAPRG